MAAEDRGVGGTLPGQDSRRSLRRQGALARLLGLGSHRHPSSRRSEAVVPRRGVYRPWIGAGMWAQWDWGTGPVIDGRATNLFCAWLARSRFRLVIPTWDRTLADSDRLSGRAMRAFGAPDVLADRQRTHRHHRLHRRCRRAPSRDRRGRRPLRDHRGDLRASRPRIEGRVGGDRAVAKADLVPTDANLRDD